MDNIKPSIADIFVNDFPTGLNHTEDDLQFLFNDIGLPKLFDTSLNHIVTSFIIISALYYRGLTPDYIRAELTKNFSINPRKNFIIFNGYNIWISDYNMFLEIKEIYFEKILKKIELERSLKNKAPTTTRINKI